MFDSRGENADPTSQFFRRRRDIQGIRAIAVLLVLAYHAKVPGFSGGYIGVDAFFVVSGFLITSLLIREFDSTNKISLTNFYARRVRRLLPASLVVVIGTLVISKIWLEPLRLNDLTQDARAAALFATNIIFAIRESDYLQSALPPSPLQHYWSLGVEEQFYIFFPLIVMLLLKLGKTSKSALIAGITVITATSFAVCIAITRSMPAVAFYLLPFRAWELGAGALLAIFSGKVSQVRSVVRELFGWVGLVVVFVTSFIYDSKTLFPGYAAGLPVIATVLLISSGDNSKFGPSRVLELRVFQWFGSRSYSLYLWHWPILIVARAANKAELSEFQVSLCVLATLLLAELSFRYVEQPIHKVPKYLNNSSRSLAFGALLIIIGLGASFITAPATAKPVKAPDSTTESSIQATTTSIFQYSDNELKELIQKAPDLTELPTNLEPPLAVLDTDEPEIYKLGCHDHEFDKPPVCEFGDLNSKTSIALIGDSHAAQWFEPLRRIAESKNWRLQTFTRSGCTMLGVENGTIEKCRVWLKNVLTEIQNGDFSLVVISGYTNREDLVDESPDGFINNITELHSALTINSQKIIYLADSPGPLLHVPICLSANIQTVQNCNFERSAAVNEQTAEILKGVWSSETSRFVDLTDWFCTNQICPVVIDNMVVYRDVSHISSAYALALTKVLQDQLEISLAG
jgi:peptidoglycan/LPS O-acetylase OafA/YrhL